MITNTIKVDQKFIKRAGLLFNASLRDIFTELLPKEWRGNAPPKPIGLGGDVPCALTPTFLSGIGRDKLEPC